MKKGKGKNNLNLTEKDLQALQRWGLSEADLDVPGTEIDILHGSDRNRGGYSVKVKDFPRRISSVVADDAERPKDPWIGLLKPFIEAGDSDQAIADIWHIDPAIVARARATLKHEE